MGILETQLPIFTIGEETEHDARTCQWNDASVSLHISEPLPHVHASLAMPFYDDTCAAEKRIDGSEL